MTRNYQDMEIFQLAYQFVIKLYPYVDKFPDDEHPNLVIQMKRSAVSMPFNIAEGSSRRTDREFLNFLGYALGSAKELEVSLSLSKDLGFLPVDDYTLLYEDLGKFVAKLLLFMRNIEQRIPLKKEIAASQISRKENPWRGESKTK